MANRLHDKVPRLALRALIRIAILFEAPARALSVPALQLFKTDVQANTCNLQPSERLSPLFLAVLIDRGLCPSILMTSTRPSVGNVG